MLNNVVIIDNIIVRQDVFERYCLSDLHKAADKQDRHQPAF
ncbi:hypothetical protein [Candidatus Regiella insecticola]|uniref:Uncharacterized protein n=1 Tax=Candidatus Regiella insecticola 5.15 TaxID=1005043 RepID=G2GYG6_9ENTR|nr:hypothetical protein [Candidatus Regiella insecticola]EGY29214.1 hypothetical protein Rin_00008240 [Candidatus Regiella insecticola 5.15]